MIAKWLQGNDEVNESNDAQIGDFETAALSCAK